MSKFVHLASVQFSSRAVKGTPEAEEIVLGELDATFEKLRGYGLELLDDYLERSLALNAGKRVGRQD